MSKRTGIAGLVALGLSAQAHGYSATASVTFSWGGNSGGTASAWSGYGATVDTTADIGWVQDSLNTLSSMSNGTYFSTLSGYASRSYYNADFATAADCTAGTGVVPATGSVISRRKYACRYLTYGGTPTSISTPVTDAAAATTGASASGMITVTDSSLIGTLTINSTTDEPTGATTTYSPSGARLSNSLGDGLNGYNYRSFDGSPYGNSWQGITTAGVLEVNLTGTFTNATWNISGGTVKFTDAGFACQQGGLGGIVDLAAGARCTQAVVSGGQQYNGAHLSWGWDVDGAGTGTDAISEIEVRDASGSATLAMLSGVLASLSVSGGTITTTSGEFRRALASALCADHIRYDGTRLSCGSLFTGRLVITGSVSEVPAPAALWLLGSALLTLRWLRRPGAGATGGG